MAIDLFGLGKQPAEESAAPEPSTEPPPRGSHRLWAFLLVLDSIFLIVFAGGVAMKLYQHWRTPAAPVVQPRRRAPKDAPKPVEPAPQAPTASSTPPVPAAPEPAKPAPAAAKTEAAPEKVSKAPAPVEPMRPPKPSMLADAPKHRATPGLADSAGASRAASPAPAAGPAPSASRAPGKAIPVQFQLRAPKAREVELVGAFIVRGGRKDMSRQSDGSWTITLYLNPGDYRYFFSVDKKKQLDPENPRTERGASVLSVP